MAPENEGRGRCGAILGQGVQRQLRHNECPEDRAKQQSHSALRRGNSAQDDARTIGGAR